MVLRVIESLQTRSKPKLFYKKAHAIPAYYAQQVTNPLQKK